MKKTDQITMRDHNQRLVLQALFNAKETSRAQLAVDLELHKSTISSIYRD
ncbi:MAG: ROK family protein, partial [Leuconostoc falkenbergense]